MILCFRTVYLKSCNDNGQTVRGQQDSVNCFKSGLLQVTLQCPDFDRFCLLINPTVALQSKIPKPRSKVIKPVTPGNKDWSRIHQTNFNKMESIDDYLARKRKRTDTLSASVKRAKVSPIEITRRPLWPLVWLWGPFKSFPKHFPMEVPFAKKNALSQMWVKKTMLSCKCFVYQFCLSIFLVCILFCSRLQFIDP